MHDSNLFIGLFRLLQIDGLGNSRVRNLLSRFGSPDAVLNAGINELSATEGISKKIALNILEERNSGKNLKAAEDQLKLIEKNKVYVLCYFDEEYPAELKNIYDPPLFIFYKGEMISPAENCFAFVGTRTPTQYGKAVTEKLIDELSQYNVTIISGLARGVDTVSHRTALKLGLKTVAVLGSGLNYVYPAENKNLFMEIIEKGCLLSEYFMGTKPDAGNFPRRNRIISGLSLGTVIIESDIEGGAMITARFALDQNKEVFAVPGNIDTRQARGPNYLIKKSEAKLITSAEDIINEFGNRFAIKGKEKKEAPLPQMNIFESKIFSVLGKEPLHIDMIADKTGLPTSECLVHLLTLEFNGLIKQLPGKLFIKSYF